MARPPGPDEVSIPSNDFVRIIGDSPHVTIKNGTQTVRTVADWVEWDGDTSNPDKFYGGPISQVVIGSPGSPPGAVLKQFGWLIELSNIPDFVPRLQRWLGSLSSDPTPENPNTSLDVRRGAGGAVTIKIWLRYLRNADSVRLKTFIGW